MVDKPYNHTDDIQCPHCKRTYSWTYKAITPVIHCLCGQPINVMKFGDESIKLIGYNHESIIIIIHSSFIASDNQKFRFDFLLDLKHYLESEGVPVWSLGFEDFDNVKPFQISGAYDQTLSQDTIRRIHALIIGFKTHALNGKYKD